MSDAPPRSMRYDRHFKINTNKRGGFGFIRDQEKINTEISRLGFFLILETDFKSTSEEILTIYRRRDVIEKSFDELKNGLDMKRLYCQSDATMEGKMFVAFISLILRSFMQNRLKDYQLATGLPFNAILKEMRKLKFVSTSDGRKMLAPVTKKQRDILNACGFSDEDISSWLKKLIGHACIV
jgi:transposase